MGNQYTDGLGYADDLTLMVPSLKGLQSLIHICEDMIMMYYSVEYQGTEFHKPSDQQMYLFVDHHVTV